MIKLSIRAVCILLLCGLSFSLAVLAKDNNANNMYSNFSTSPNLIFVQILNRDHPTQSADIICENSAFYEALRNDPIFAPIIKSSTYYAKYMQDSEGIIFGLSDNAYKSVASWPQAPLTNEMQKDLREGKKYIINKYLEKLGSATNSNTGEKYYSWFIKAKYHNSPSVMRILLQSGFSVRRSCLAAIYYIEDVDESMASSSSKVRK